MNTLQRATRALPAALVAVALGGMGATAMAATNANPESINIEASKLGTVTLHSHAGIHAGVAQLSQHVSYRDLDLATSTGADELTSRIQLAATSVCDRLGALYPADSRAVEVQEERLCVATAVNGAMSQAKVAIASAER